MEIEDDSSVTIRGVSTLLDLQAEISQVRKLFTDSQGELFWRQHYTVTEDLLVALEELIGGVEGDDDE